LNQGSQNISDYLLNAKSWVDQLAAVGKAIDDEDLISYVVGGLNSSYHPFITSLSFATRDVPISFDAFQIELLNFEYLLESHVKSVPPEANQVAFFTQKSKQQYYNKKTKFQQYPNQHLHPPQQQRPNFPNSNTRGIPPAASPRQNGKSYSPNSQFFNTNRAPCQICGKTNHQALDCYRRMDFSFQGRHPPYQLAAMTAHAHAVPENEQPWYLDSGANNHVTAELENLSLQQPYQGSNSVTVGNGGGLQIANRGSTLISTPKTLLYLHNILHCPNASSNLLSIQKFCKDNNCYFILTSTYFVIKDLWTKEILMQGPSEDGLYPIYLKQLQRRKRASKVAFVSSFTAFLGVTAPVLSMFGTLDLDTH
jgi:hypothetical protein